MSANMIMAVHGKYSCFHVRENVLLQQNKNCVTKILENENAHQNILFIGHLILRIVLCRPHDSKNNPVLKHIHGFILKDFSSIYRVHIGRTEKYSKKNYFIKINFLPKKILLHGYCSENRRITKKFIHDTFPCMFRKQNTCLYAYTRC